MEEPNVYAAPKAESLVDARFESFGGWLRFFQVINYISASIIIFMFFMVAVFFAFGQYGEGELFEAVIAAVELIPDLIIPLLILQIIKIKRKEIPQRLVKLLGIYLVCSLVVYAVVYYLFKTDVVADKPVSFWGSLIYYYIWLSYFKKSKRVKAYYGENAIG